MVSTSRTVLRPHFWEALENLGATDGYRIIPSGLHQHLKKKPTPNPLSRRCQRVGNDSQSGRLQMLFHQTISIATLRLDGPTHARLPTDHVIGQVPQPALQTVHRFIRHMTHSQRGSQHL